MSLNLEIITPHGAFLDTKCHIVSIPAAKGYMGVMKQHCPTISALKNGIISVYKDKDNISHKVKIGDGFAETCGDKLLILTDKASFV